MWAPFRLPLDTWLLIVHDLSFAARSTLNQFIFLLSHNIPAAFNSNKFLWPSVWVSIGCHINTHQPRTHQKGSMSLKPNLSGVLPGVLDTHRFNFHSEVSILRCAALSDSDCGIWARRSAIFSKNLTVFLPERVTKRGLLGPGGWI